MGGGAAGKTTAAEGARYQPREGSDVKLDLVDAWGSPSVLHLRVLITTRDNRRIATESLHVPFEMLPKGALLAWLVEDRERYMPLNGDPPLF